MAGCGFSSGLYQDILKAQDLISKRKFKEAVSVYENILNRKPTKNIKIKINFQLGEIYSIYLNDYHNGLIHFNHIVNESNEPVWQVKALEKVGNIYFENLKHYQKSKYVYQKLMTFIPKLENKEFYEFRYALSLFYLKKYSEVISLFESSDNKEKNIRIYYYLGLSHFYKSGWTEAVNSWLEYLKRESRKDLVVKTKFMIANAYESNEELKKAYNIYYSILGEYPNPEIIKNRLNSLYERRISRKR